MRGGLAAAALVFAWAVPPAASAAERDLLVIALDAVPYAAAAAAHAGGASAPARLSGFQRPVPVISTFPSTTSVALGDILGAHGLERSPGYEARFFDWERRAKAGGGPISYFRVRFDWREFFDWNRKGPFRSFLAAARPVRSGIREIETALARFADSSASAYLIYIAPTDTAMHLYGPQSAQRIFAALDEALARTREQRAARPFDTVIFSDHGIAGGEEPLVNVRRGLKRALRQAGLAIVDRLRAPGQVVLTPYGLVSSFELYTAPADEATVLQVAAGTPGVAVCAAADGDSPTWTIAGSGGRAGARRLQGPDGVRWSYRVEGTDPLGLEPLVAGRAGPDETIDDAILLEATAKAEMPDPLHRIAGTFELVDNPASVACSLAPGFMYGPRRTELLARLGKGRLRWTHGALGRDETLGFVMSDASGWAPAGPLRADQALAPFAETVRLARGLPALEEAVASGD